MWIRNYATKKGLPFHRRGASPRMAAWLFLAVLASASPALSDAEDEIIVGLRINGEEKGDLFVVPRESDFLVKASDLGRAGVELKDAELPAGEDVRLSLKSLAGVSWRFDEERLVLELTVDPSRLPATFLDLSPGRPADILYPMDDSFFLNYAVDYTESDYLESNRIDLSGEMGIRKGKALFLTDSTYRKEGSERRHVRLLTSLTVDRREEKQRFTAGDFFSSTGTLGSSVLLGGFGVSKVYAMDPYFIRHPMMRLSGAAALPSELEVYLDGIRMRKETIPSGPFEIDNLSHYGGAHTVEIVIRDAFGREERMRYPYYFTDRLLGRGLHEYSYNAGLVRQRLGEESTDYGDYGYAFFHRYGLKDTLTLGARGEGGEGVQNGGFEGTFSAGHYGVFSAALSASSSETAGRGEAASLQYGYQRSNFSARMTLAGYSPLYRTLADHLSEVAADAPRRFFGIGAGYGNARMGALSFDYSDERRTLSGWKKTKTLTYAKGFRGNVNLFSTLKRIDDNGHSQNEIFVGLSWYAGGETSVSARYQKTDAETTEALQVQKNAPVGEGTGYIAAVDRRSGPAGEAYVVYPSVQYKGRRGIVRADYEGEFREQNRSNAYHLSLSGAAVYVGGAWGLTRPVPDSFALVKVGDLGGVGVMVNNQPVGKTDGDGLLFVPGLNSYYGNNISIADRDVSMNYSLDAVSRYVSPPLRSGSCIVFGVNRFKAFTGRLLARTATGTVPVEFQEIVLLRGEERITATTGRGGGLYLENAGPREASRNEAGRPCMRKKGEDRGRDTWTYIAEVDYNGRRRTFEISLPGGDETLSDMGVIVIDAVDGDEKISLNGSDRR